MKHATLALGLCLVTATSGCGVVRDLVRDPVGTVGTPFEFADPLFSTALSYVFDGALNVLVLAIVVASDNDFDAYPRGGICHFTCASGEDPLATPFAELSCSNCETGEAVYAATGDALVVTTEGDWYVEEFADANANAFAVTFETSGDTHWTWTNGSESYEEEVRVRDTVDLAVFDLAAGNVELDRVELEVGQTLDLELLPVDAEGHVLAGFYEAVSFASPIVQSERQAFVAIEGWDEAGTIAQLTGTTSGETTMTIRARGGVERTLTVVVR